MPWASDMKSQLENGHRSLLRPNSMIRSSGAGPRLLVSVRSQHEAERALAGGAEILDVKEPSFGSLGMAAFEDMAAIAGTPEISSRAIPLSVAMGEVCDWPQQAKFFALPSHVSFAKLGLSQCARRTDWQTDWLRVRTEFERQSLSELRWVAVAYADSTEAISPSISDIMQAAIETHCAGLLVDTWTKDGRTLLDEIDAMSLSAIADECHAAGLFLALAGRLNRDALQGLANVPADVIAIRSAACHGIDRTSELDSTRVAEFRNEVRRWFGPTQVEPLGQRPPN